MESFAQSADGVVLVANGQDPMLRWDGYTSTATPAGVTPPAAAPIVTASGSGSIDGTYYAYLRFVDRFGNYSNLSPVSGPGAAIAAGTITFSNLAVPQQSTVERRQILRNTAGQTDVFYVDVDTTDLFSTSLSSTRVDGDLATQEQSVVADDAVDFGVPPADKPFLVWHQNRMYALGIEPYQDGSCEVAFGSATVQGRGTNWKATFAGRYFYTPDGGRSYLVDACDPVAQTLTLTDTYTGPTDLFAAYAVKPAPGESNSFGWSGPNQPEAWNPLDKLNLPEDGDTVTGGMNYGSYLYLLKTRRMYRLIVRSDPAVDGRLFLACNRGAINNRCWVVVDETVFLMDQGGVYAYKGDDQGEQVSTAIQDMFSAEEPGTGPKINMRASRYFHACLSPREEVVRWHVALAGDFVPRHAICYAYKEGKWSIERLPCRAGASVLSRIGGGPGTVAEAAEQHFVGSSGGRVIAPGLAALDGNPVGGTTRGTVGSAGWLSLTDPSAAFASDAVGVPVVIVSGPGRGQYRMVTAVSGGTRLSLDRPWRVKPDATSTYQLGGIPFAYASQRVRWAVGEQSMARGVEIEFYPTAVPTTVRVALAPDFMDPLRVAWTIDTGVRSDVTAAVGALGQDVLVGTPSGHVLVRSDSWRESSTDGAMGRTARLILSGVAGDSPVRIGTVLITGAAG